MSRNRDFSALWRGGLALLFALWLAACGGGSGGGDGDGGESPDPGEGVVVCETGDVPADSGQCGQVFIGFSDLEGDFIRYRVDIVALSLFSADGVRIEVLSGKYTVDVIQYRALSELVAAATLPVGNYVRAEITLDYSDADIRVDVAGKARKARIVDAEGRSVREVTLALEIDPLNQPLVAPGLPLLLQLDFNLAASHIVDTLAKPPIAQLFPVVTAEFDPLQLKAFRLRGPLIAADERQVSFRIAVRPFNRTRGRLGGVDIHIRGETDWEIDGEFFAGSSGLSAAVALPVDTLTLAFGRYDRAARMFIAEQVFAGGSVPGVALDAIEGLVLARSANTLTLLGARLVCTDGSVAFRDRAILLLGDNTLVSKPGFPLQQLTPGAVSVGQRITALGVWDPGEKLLDATAGQVRLLETRLDATLNNRIDLELAVTALEFGGRDAALFDFTGTGKTAAWDADPAGYLVDVESLSLPLLALNAPLRIGGTVAPFGRAPADFEAVAVGNFVDGGAQLMVTWIGAGSIDAFVSLDANGLQPNLNADLLGSEHFIRRGAVLTDLLALTPVPRLVPVLEGGLYALAQGDVITLYSDFGDFATDLDLRMDLGAAVKILHAEGGYRSGAASMTVTGLEVVLID